MTRIYKYYLSGPKSNRHTEWIWNVQPTMYNSSTNYPFANSSSPYFVDKILNTTHMFVKGPD